MRKPLPVTAWQRCTRATALRSASAASSRRAKIGTASPSPSPNNAQRKSAPAGAGALSLSVRPKPRDLEDEVAAGERRVVHQDHGEVRGAAVDVAEHHRDRASECAGTVEAVQIHAQGVRSEEHTSELQSQSK